MSEHYISSRKYFKAGLWLLIAPPVFLILVLIAFAVTSFILVSTVPADVVSTTGTVALGEPDIRATAGMIISAVLGLLGLVALIVFAFGLKLGIVFLCKKELAPGVAYDERSGKGAASTVPAEVAGGWNWAAAGLPTIWGAYHNVWMFLIGWIPLVGMVWWIVMGVKGNEWAWRKFKWISVEQFKASQRKWRPWGIAVFVLYGLYFAVVIVKALGGN